MLEREARANLVDRDFTHVGGAKTPDAEMRALKVTPHITQNTSGRRSALDARIARHPGYQESQRMRKRRNRSGGASPSADLPDRCCAESRNSTSSSR